jgi:hypothetical protein
MKKFLALVALAGLIFWFYQKNDEKDKIEEFRSRTESAGEGNVPVSNDSKQKIENALNDTGAIEHTHQSHKETLISKDCQNWLTSKEADQIKFDQKDSIFAKSGSETMLVEPSNHLIITMGAGRHSYLIVSDTQIIGFSNDGLIFRQVRKGTIMPGFVGLIQAESLYAAEFQDQWQFMIRDGKPILYILWSCPVKTGPSSRLDFAILFHA